MGKRVKGRSKVKGAKPGLGPPGKRGVPTACQNRLLGSGTHSPAVTLTFTLTGEWQGGGFAIWEQGRRRKGKAAWSVSPWRY